jgi:perosamine synthetase
MNVPIIRIPYSPEDRRVIRSGLDEILDSGVLTMGKFTKRFEEMFAAFSGCRRAVACSNGTAALELILRGLEIEGKSVIVPTNTFLATALAVMRSGNRVIFADSEVSTFALDIGDVKRRLARDTAALVIVHVGGLITPAIREIQGLCAERGIHLIEDCAHAHGCSFEGQLAGSFGIAGAFSFFPTKVLTTGEGGMVTTSDEELACRVEMLRNHGKNPQLGNRMSECGYNHRMSEITALLGVQQMSKASEIIAERRRVATLYDSRLPDIEGITPVRVPDGGYSTYYKYIAMIDDNLDRSDLKIALKNAHGVSLTGEVYAELCHTEPLFEQFTYCGSKRAHPVSCHRWPSCGCDEVSAGFPGAAYLSAHHICLPVYPGLTEAEVNHVVASLREVVATMMQEA